MAAECRRTWAPLIGALIPARRSASRTIWVTAARVSGRTWARSLFLGLGDALLGLIVVVANALIK